ncbi:hypothetical protein SNE40_012264 [Patella caerulea]|uniref:dual-specificity kinase n=1 Tax=Patella caerulea TaxID=87958 RepID=A0AAN8Q0G2_PATCE
MGVCVHEGQLHALTEFVNGGSLEQQLAEEEELPWIWRIKLSLDIARGMKYIHSRGFIHRDLTSKNVLVKKEPDGNMRAIVADFGLSAKIPDPLDPNIKLSIVGSPYWMAPEVLRGEFYNELADVFSYGIILCEITARIEADPDILPRTANFGVDYVALSEMVIYSPLDFLHLAFKCCHVDPKKRPCFGEIEVSVEKIFKNLQNDLIAEAQNNKRAKRKGCKRSKSEDNILQANDSSSDVENVDELPTTALLIGQFMSKDDQFYLPTENNPFASYNNGRKLFGTPREQSSDLPSPTAMFTPPCTPITPDSSFSFRQKSASDRKCQSLPSSPVLLRKAAEEMHMESLHGSAKWNTHQQILKSRSKSMLMSESLSESIVQKLLYCGEGNSDKDDDDNSGDESLESKSNSVHRPNPLSCSSRRLKFGRAKFSSVDCEWLSSSSTYTGNGLYNERNCDDLEINDKENNSNIQRRKKRINRNSPARSSCDSFMSIDELPHSPSSSLSSYGDANEF